MTRNFRHRHHLFIAAFITFLVALSGQPLKAAVATVGNCVSGGIHFTTIQAAVNGVAAGSTIRVCPGIYPEQVVINKNLTVSGVESDNAFNPTLVMPSSGGFTANTSSLSSGAPLAGQIVVAAPATDVEISNLTVDGTGNNLNNGCSDTRLIGIIFQNASGTINYVVARNQAQNTANFGCAGSAGLGIFVQSAGPSTPSEVTIRNSSVYGFQKNGITANETGTTVRIRQNSVVGGGPVGIAQNAIQIGFGATGLVENNNLADTVFNGDPAAGTGSGILVFDSGDVSIRGNSITFTQNGIAVVTDGSQTSDNNTIINNQVSNTLLGDGIDLCSNGNSVIANSIFSSVRAGIHLDGSCSPTSTGNNNSVSRNVVNDACAGILLGSGTGNRFFGGNAFANVANTTLMGDTCTAAAPSVRANSQLVSAASHPASPVRP
jgi:Right handed beta helix region